ncbi:hypothetical protein FCULG_00005286 [Fusarium culmorum]|uniref:Uncharacterized protein n=1 Tax=Fusarium culmorum TaxID=5516 RepID=A0A2T4GTI0_FUSCU|nr:hypothetical protein FCULG_00005286 [Fusarium culmorum]
MEVKVINSAKVGKCGFASLSKLNKLAIRGLNIQWQDLSDSSSQDSLFLNSDYLLLISRDLAEVDRLSSAKWVSYQATIAVLVITIID